jgi:hypothetical protein
MTHVIDTVFIDAILGRVLRKLGLPETLPLIKLSPRMQEWIIAEAARRSGALSSTGTIQVNPRSRAASATERKSVGFDVIGAVAASRTGDAVGLSAVECFVAVDAICRSQQPVLGHPLVRDKLPLRLLPQPWLLATRYLPSVAATASAAAPFRSRYLVVQVSHITSVPLQPFFFRTPLYLSASGHCTARSAASIAFATAPLCFAASSIRFSEGSKVFHSPHRRTPHPISPPQPFISINGPRIRRDA